MQRNLSNRSLDRGLALLEALSQVDGCTLADLHRSTGLAKSTIRRLLGTLIDRGVVWRAVSDQKYRTNLSVTTRNSDARAIGAGRIAEVAMPHLKSLTERIQWPSDLHMFEGTHMRVIDSTRPLSPFKLYQGVINSTLNIFGCATGRTCLAYSPKRSVQEIYEAIGTDPKQGLIRYDADIKGLWPALETIRKQGYGQRIEGYTSETIVDDKLQAVAVPYFHKDYIVGGITVLFPKKYLPQDRQWRANLAQLTKCANAITRDLSNIKIEEKPQDWGSFVISRSSRL